jgi:hypothetical protein
VKGEASVNKCGRFDKLKTAGSQRNPALLLPFTFHLSRLLARDLCMQGVPYRDPPATPH